MRVCGLTVGKRVKDLKTEVRRLRRDIKQKDAEVARLEQSPEHLRQERDRLKQERDRLTQELATAQRARKRQAAPFSKGQPKSTPQRPGRKGGPKYGPKRRRKVPAQVDNEVDARLPAGCPTCHGAIAPERVEDQDQEEIGRRVHVTRFRVHIGHCVACGTRVQGRHPSQTSEATGAAAAQVGPEALAFAAILNQEFGLSYGKTVAVRQRGFGLTLTPGGLSQALARLAARCEPTDEHRKAVVRTQPSVTLDETGWRIGGHPAWLHVAATADATVYGIFAGRGVDAAAALIGADYDGGLVRDGWAPYRRCEAAYHQTCTPASDQPVRRAHGHGDVPGRLRARHGEAGHAGRHRQPGGTVPDVALQIQPAIERDFDGIAHAAALQPPQHILAEKRPIHAKPQPGPARAQPDQLRPQGPQERQARLPMRLPRSRGQVKAFGSRHGVYIININSCGRAPSTASA